MMHFLKFKLLYANNWCICNKADPIDNSLWKEGVYLASTWSTSILHLPSQEYHSEKTFF